MGVFFFFFVFLNGGSNPIFTNSSPPPLLNMPFFAIFFRRKNLRDAICQTDARRRLLNAPNNLSESCQTLASNVTTDTALPTYDPCTSACGKSHSHYADPNLPSQLGAVSKKIIRPAPSTPQSNARSAAQRLNQDSMTEFDRNTEFLRTQSFRDPSQASFTSFGRPTPQGPAPQKSYYEMQPPPGIQSSMEQLLPPPPPPLRMVDSNGFQTAEFTFESKL